MKTEFEITQTHPNKGTITILFPGTKNACYKNIPFYVNNQVAPGIGSNRQPVYEIMHFENKYNIGIQAECLQDLANAISIKFLARTENIL